MINKNNITKRKHTEIYNEMHFSMLKDHISDRMVNIAIRI